MKNSNKTSANSCEEIFDEFVLWYGGELTDTLFQSNKNRPSNADYLLSNRNVVAELKCLQKEFFNSPIIEKKRNKMIQSWLRKGKIPYGYISKNKITIPEQLAPKIVDLYKTPIKSALEKANRQIKITKQTHGEPDAKGLLFLVNERNSALFPDYALSLLRKLLSNRYTQISSFIYIVFTIPMETPTLGKITNLWISSPARDSSEGIDQEIVKSLREGWHRFLEMKFKYKVELIAPKDLNILKEFDFIRNK